MAKNDFLLPPSSPRSFYGFHTSTVTSLNDYILPIVSSNEDLPPNSDGEIIFDAIDNTDILLVSF